MFRKNVASQFIHFQGVDSATGGIKSGVTWTVRRCIDGTFAAGGGTVTEDGTTGWYKYAMSQADTNGNNIAFNFTGTGAVPQTINIITTAADPTDNVRLGLTSLPNAAAEADGGLYTRGTGAGQINQSANGLIDDNVVNWKGSTAPAMTGDAFARLGAPVGASVSADVAGIQTDTDDIQTRLPASLVSGRIDSSVGAMDTDVITATAISSAGLGKIVDGVWNALTSAMTTVGSVGKKLADWVIGTAQTGDNYARLGAPVGASISADIAANKTVVDAIKVRTDLTPEGFKKNTARSNFTFVMTDSTTHAGKTGIADGSFTKKYRLDNGSATSLSGTITEVDSTNFPGLYSIDLTSGELNGDMVEFRFAASGADDLVITIKTSA